MNGQREPFIRQTRRPTYFLRQGLARTRQSAGQHRMFISRNPQPLTSSGAPHHGRPRREVSVKGRNEMHPEDVMKADLLSEIILLGSGGLILVSLLLIVVTAFTQA